MRYRRVDRPSGKEDPYYKVKTRDLTRAYHRRLCDPGALADVRTHPFDLFSCRYGNIPLL